jgi:hypothetical protein
MQLKPITANWLIYLLNLFFGICGGALFGIAVVAFFLWSVGSATADSAIYTDMVTGITLGAVIGALAAYRIAAHPRSDFMFCVALIQI